MQLSNEKVFLYLKLFLLIPIASIVIWGAGGMAISFLLSLLPFIHESRRSLVVPLFLVAGLITGVVAGVKYYSIVKKTPKNGTSNTVDS